MHHDGKTYFRALLPWLGWGCLAWTLLTLAVLGRQDGFVDLLADDWGVALWMPACVGLFCWISARISF